MILKNTPYFMAKNSETVPTYAGLKLKDLSFTGSDPRAPMQILTVKDDQQRAFLQNKSQTMPNDLIGTHAFELLCQRMLATVTDPEAGGVGLAAPQVGIGLKVIAVQRFDKEEAPFEIFVNPCISEYGGEPKTAEEGCLSVPDESDFVTRATRITVRHTSPATLKEEEITIEGFTAVIFQHEIDHLDGILYTDRAEEQTRRLSYIPDRSVCATQIDLAVRGGIVIEASVTGGCKGNRQAVCALVKGMEIEDVISKLKGIKCGDKATSCPDQLALALEQMS